MFSTRVPARLESNALSRAVERARASGRTLIDLTLSNPTRAGIEYPPGLFQALSRPDVARYCPHPFGLDAARQAVAADFRRRGVAAAADRIVLTSSTSEAYSLLFKLLCAPSGDAVLVPVPSYPLFEHLTSLDGVAAVPYRLAYDGRWWVDFHDVDERWTPRIRAVLAVSPNNPTGSVLADAELDRLDAACAARTAALIIDEVFADYPLEAPAAAINAGLKSPSAALTFRLGGLSKSAALPQVKLGWIAVDGPKSLVHEALERLELICDTYLSVSTEVQVAAPELIAGGADTRRQVTDRVRGNYATLCARVSEHRSTDVLNLEAGWSAVLRVLSRSTEEEIVLDLIERDGVIVHPGYFFDFPHEAFLVVSLLPEPETFAEGVRRVLERVDA
ncbi:MAG: pyridoxal phosphate-dependent aminotransferase [Vicinamibacterales bacterium]